MSPYIGLNSETFVFPEQFQTVCPESLDPIYIVTQYLKRVKASWTYSRAFIKMVFFLLAIINEKNYITLSFLYDI